MAGEEAIEGDYRRVAVIAFAKIICIAGEITRLSQQWRD